MSWIVEYTDEFGAWWQGLTEAEQVSVQAIVGGMKSLCQRPTFFTKHTCKN